MPGTPGSAGGCVVELEGAGCAGGDVWADALPAAIKMAAMNKPPRNARASSLNRSRLKMLRDQPAGAGCARRAEGMDVSSVLLLFFRFLLLFLCFLLLLGGFLLRVLVFDGDDLTVDGVDIDFRDLLLRRLDVE